MEILFILLIVISLSCWIHYDSKKKTKPPICTDIFSKDFDPSKVCMTLTSTPSKYSTPEESRKIALKSKYAHLSTEEIVFNKEIGDNDKVFLLREIYGYTHEEAEELFETAIKVEKKAKLAKIKRKISQKAQELYGNIPTDDKRKPIPDEVKMFVWNRDNGKCVKCGSRESLEYDHIIPVSKGGSNTERNIQLLCEKCNRSKRDNIA